MEIIKYLLIPFIIGIVASIIAFLTAPPILLDWFIRHSKTYKITENKLKTKALNIINSVISKSTISLDSNGQQINQVLHSLNENISTLEKLSSDLFILDTLSYLFDSVTFVTSSSQDAIGNLEDTYNYIQNYSNRLSDALKKAHDIKHKTIPKLFDLIFDENPKNKNELRQALWKAKKEVERLRQEVTNKIKSIQIQINQQSESILNE